MVRAIMSGCNGAMGQVITQMASEDPDIEIVAGIDINTEQRNGYPVFASLSECSVEADVVIDFSSAKATDSLLAGMVEKKLPGVLCSTGLSEEQLEAVKKTSEQVAVLKSANMSVGVNLIFKLLETITPILAKEGYDMEIVEKHHHRKVDAPSGTALAMADVMNASVGNAYHYKFDRTQERVKRDPMEIGIQAVRGGTIVGDHDVIFAGTDEVITISHSAYSRAIFGKGALAAAKFLAGKPAGYYDMRDVIG
ncbi:4-hydroxy-tetrahydrodipicolinate reductase [Hominifimenecus sp. rT4P-3]|uniref:4-hydroxy-tetrahydrodipicolinate reductase n=1 Tax=Hominifimenecus sp. rT4P-3 TaxID=3242979 RepID=UPI003DA5D78A